MKKTLAILLTLALVICMIPTSVYAADATQSLNVSLTLNSTTYDGTPKTPTVKVGSTDVTSNNGYTMKWEKDGVYSADFDLTSNIVDAGTYKVTVTETSSNKTGTATCTVAPYNLSKVNILIDNQTADPAADATLTTLGNAASYYYSGNKITDTKIINLLTSKITVKLTKNGSRYYVDYSCADTTNFSGSVPSTSFNIVSDIVRAKLYVYEKVNNSTKKVEKGLLSDNTGLVIDAGAYDGKAKTINSLILLTVTKDGKEITLNNNKDYVLEYKEAKNAGRVDVTIKGTGEYGGKVVLQAEVTRRPASNLTYDTVPNQTIATYNDYVPVIRDKGLGTTLEKGKDFLIRSVSGTAGGPGSMTVELIGNYDGEITIPFTVVADDYNIENMIPYRNDVNLASRPISQTGAPYTGSAQYISGSVVLYRTMDDYNAVPKKAVSSSNYAISYEYTDKDGKLITTSAPTDAAYYDVYVVGKGSYAGKQKIGTFTIPQYDMKNATVSATVTSATIAPAVTVRGANGVTFVKDKDYTIYYYANYGKTTVTVSVTPTGNGNLRGSTVSKTYTVSARSMSYCTVAFRDGRSSAVYTGYAIPIDIYVLDGTTTLTKGVHYNVVYRNSAGKVVSTIRDAGTYTIEVVGDGGYTGTKTLTFTVTGNDISSYTVTLDKSSANATGYAITLPRVLSVARGSAKLTTSDYTVSYKDSDDKTVSRIVNPGTYKVVVTGAGKYSGSTYAVFTAVGKSQSITGVKSTYKAYPGGEVIQLYPKATEGRFTYTSSDSTVATVSASGLVTPLKAGRAKITIKTTGTTTYDPATYSTVIKVYPKKAVMTKKPWNYGKKGQVKVRWYKQDNVTRYEIRYSRAKNFAKGTYITKKVNAAQNDYTTQSTTLKKLKRGQRYYVKVRAVKEVYNDYGKKLTYYGKWSGWRSVVVK